MPNYNRSYPSSRSAARPAARPAARHYSKHGAYNLDDGPWAQRGATIGSAVARSFGAPSAVGEYIGRRLFHYPAKYFGSGKYGATKAVAARRTKTYARHGAYEVGETSVMSPEIPRFSKGGDDDSIVVSHREYIGDIFTSASAGAFKIDEFIINPGDAITFPWLSSLAQCSYQQYKFSGCVFEFVSTSADALNSTNTALGAVVSCINYDSNDATFNSRMQMENTSWANACKPSQNMSIPVECDAKMTSMQGLLYVSENGIMPANADPKTYILGKLSIATTGFQGTSINIGSLYVTYKVKLFKPIMARPLANANRTLLVRTGCTSAVPFGTATSTTLAVPAECDTLGVTFTATTLTIPKKRLQNGQRFVMVAQFIHDNGATTCPGITYSTNLDQFAAFGTAASAPTTYPAFGFPNAAGATQVYCGFVAFFGINNDNADAVLTLSAATFPANCVANIQIYQVCGTPSAQLGITV